MYVCVCPGVGQSEFAVADMVDLFVLLIPPAGGDELQVNIPLHLTPFLKKKKKHFFDINFSLYLFFYLGNTGNKERHR